MAKPIALIESVAMELRLKLSVEVGDMFMPALCRLARARGILKRFSDNRCLLLRSDCAYALRMMSIGC